MRSSSPLRGRDRPARWGGGVRRRAARERRRVDLQRPFRQNIRLVGGVAPVRVYIPELLADVLAGKLDPSPVLDLTVDLAGVPEGYSAMDGRRATKVMVRL